MSTFETFYTPKTASQKMYKKITLKMQKIIPIASLNKWKWSFLLFYELFEEKKMMKT